MRIGRPSLRPSLASLLSVAKGGASTIHLEQDAPTRAAAFTAAAAAVEAVLGPGSVSKVVGGDDDMQNRQLLLWLVAARQQLRRWEATLADVLRDELHNRRAPGHSIWQSEVDKHLALVALNNVLRAIDNADGRYTSMDEEIARDIRNQRDLHEHWNEQMPAFYYVPSSPEVLHRGGVTFAQRHPGRRPFGGLSWNSRAGPELGPGILASAVHSYLDLVQSEVLRSAPSLEAYVQPPLPSPWLGEEYSEDRWWPRDPAG